MSDAERDEFLASERTCRAATIGADGPHASPLWFGWDGRYAWLYSLTRSKRWADLQRDPRISLVVDAGVDYFELRGVEIMGTAHVVGDIPRSDAPVAELDEIERLFAAKYMNSDRMFHDGRHAWLRVTPTKIASWDFRKLAEL
jgi:hypothetical protein